MLARNPDSDNIKLPGCGDFLCIISRELHNDFTSCPQDCPQGRRRSEFAKACGAKACGPPPRREATLTYVALRSKSQAGNKNEESLDASAATCNSHRRPVSSGLKAEPDDFFQPGPVPAPAVLSLAAHPHVAHPPPHHRHSNRKPSC